MSTSTERQETRFDRGACVTLAFAATLRDEVDLDRMTGELVAVVEKTIQPEQVGLWLQPAAQVGKVHPPGRSD
jgi:hypothetical protein